MPKKYMFIDYENLQPCPTDLITARKKGYLIWVFVGEKQRKLADKLESACAKANVKIVCIDCYSGKNAMDFHIIFYVGQLFAKNKSAELYILSKDRGFDPIIRHLHNQELQASRKECIPE